MEKPILVTYATRSGSTAGIAEAIARTLEASGRAVEVRPMNAITDLSPYRAVVAGSPIQGQKWLPDAMQFLRTHRAALGQRPFAAFMVCITLSMKNAGQYRQGLSAWMAPVRALAPTVGEGMFAGTLDFQKMPLTFNTLLMRLPVWMGFWKEGDHRDWKAIQTWAEQIRPLL